MMRRCLSPSVVDKPPKMKQRVSLVLTVCLLMSAMADKVDFSGEMVVSVVPETVEVLDYLYQLEEGGVISFWSPEWRSVTARFDFQISKINFRSLADYLTTKGLKASIKIGDLQEVIETRQKEIYERKIERQTKEFDFENFHVYDELVAFMEETSANSSLATFSTIGSTHEGRDIAMVRVHVGGDVTNKSIIMLECGIHAREWIAPATCIWIFDQLVKGYGIDTEATSLLEAFDWLIVPCTNPDGYEYTWKTNRLWRKNRSPNNGSACVGTDSNRNFASNWGGVGSSGDPCSETHRGASVFSEAESSAIRDALTANSGLVQAYVSVHSHASLWMTPFGFTSELPPDYNEMIRVMGAGVDALEATHGTPFTLGNAADVLYFTSGGSRDYAYLGQNITFSCTIEARDELYGFVPPTTEILPTAQEIWNGIKAMAFALP